MSNIMINPAFMHHIPDNKKEECYNSMLKDVYYFYNSIKLTPEQHIILLDGNYFNLSKDNLLLLNNDKPRTERQNII